MADALFVTYFSVADNGWCSLNTKDFLNAGFSVGIAKENTAVVFAFCNLFKNFLNTKKFYSQWFLDLFIFFPFISESNRDHDY